MSTAMVEVEILRDVWVPDEKTGEMIRHRAGTFVTVPLDESILDQVASGAVRRVTPEVRAERAKARRG